ncbi:MAG: NAD-binding protein, partial [Phycisphaerae bacterium]|nr:NAD-binding protein [Phycisphaerae bacterium]
MDRYAIIGLGRFGRRLAGQLTSSGAEIIAIDRDPDIIEQIRDDVTLALRMDSTDSRALV